MPKLESVQVILVHYNLVNKNYQQTSKVLFNLDNSDSQTIAPHLLTMLNTANAKFLSIDLWFTDQSSQRIEIEDNVYMTLLIGQIYKMRYSTEPKYKRYVQGSGFFSFA